MIPASSPASARLSESAADSWSWKIKWAGLLPQTWGGEEKKEEDHRAKDTA